MDHVLRIAIEERIRALIEHRRWQRSQSPGTRPYFAGFERDTTVELRALLKLYRYARRVTRQAEYLASAAVDARIDRVLEAIEAPYNPEGDPTLNGAYL